MNTKSLLSDLIALKGPSGQEDEVLGYCEKKLKPLVDDLWVDAAGNLIGLKKGKSSKEPTLIMAHLDELSLIVKRVEENGTLRVNPLGGIYPFDFGQGPVEILGDKKSLPGIISGRSVHTTEETKDRWRSMPRGGDKPLRWEEMHVFTGLSVKELEKAGVHPGSRVVIGKARRTLEEVGPYVAGHFFDNRASVAAALVLANALKKPSQDLYFVFTTEEEIGAHGASFAAQKIPNRQVIAIDVAPVAEEYQTVLNEEPVIVYQDAVSVYTKALCDDLFKAAEKIKLKPQRAIFSNYGSDASLAKQRGGAAKAALIALPTENTHGFEIIHPKSVDNVALTLAELLK